MALLDTHMTDAHETTHVSGESYAEALRDARAQQFASESLSYLRRLQDEGRDHSLPSFLSQR